MYISTCTGALPFLFALPGLKQLYKQNQPFVLLISITVVVEAVAMILFFNRANNMWLYYSYTVVEFALLTASLQRMQYQKVPVQVTGALVLLVLAVTLADVLYISGLQLYNAFSRSVSCLLLIIISLFAFYDLIKNHSQNNFGLSSSALFWLALAILTYMAGNMFVFAVSNFLYTSKHPLYNNVWQIHSVLNIIFNIILVNVVLCLKKPQPSIT